MKAGNLLCELNWDEHQWLDYGFVQRFLKGYQIPSEAELLGMVDRDLEADCVGDPLECW